MLVYGKAMSEIALTVLGSVSCITLLILHFVLLPTNAFSFNSRNAMVLESGISIEDATADKPATGSYRLVALDLDGTLLRSNHKLGDETAQYLRELDAKGFNIMIATGRGPATIYEHVVKLALPHPMPVVCSNGARGLSCSGTTVESMNVEELFSTPVPADIVQQTLLTANKLGMVVQYYIGDDIYANPSTPDHRVFTDRYILLTGSKTKYVNDDFQEVMSSVGLPSKLLILCDHEVQDSTYNVLREDMGDRKATLVMGTPAPGWFIEVLHPDVCKGHGLRKYCEEHLKIPLSEVLAFGDGDNDKEFVQMAGYGIAMQNARDVLKDVADEVIELTNDQDGVMHTLKRMEQNGLLNY